MIEFVVIYIISGIILFVIIYIVVIILSKIKDFIEEKIIKKLLKRQKQKQIDNIIRMEEGINYNIEECVICMEQKHMLEQKCKHKMCKECWLEIIERFKVCPLCRIPIKLKELKYTI
jgi:Na+-translocating ferredoxin:NAD+ oxidoreductase RnfG subunit